MTTQNKIADAIKDAIKCGEFSVLVEYGIVRREEGAEESRCRFSVSYLTLGNIGLCYPSDVALRLGGRVSEGIEDRKLRVYFTDTYELNKFCSVVSDMIAYQEHINNKCFE